MDSENFKKSNLSAKLSTTVFYLAILFFIIGFSFTDAPPGPFWVQQFMLNINGRQITDVYFLDSLTGWSVTNNQNQDSAFVLRTTNSGDNWTIQYRKLIGSGTSGYFRVYFLNETTGYACSVTGFDKTTNGGISWAPIWTADTYVDMSILSVDTQWLVSSNSLTGGVFYTSNGGVNWTVQYSAGTANPDHIYMYNARIGFISIASGSALRRTTNGGANWVSISGEDGFIDVKFIDSLTGWKTNNRDSIIKKTIDGGDTWVRQILPHGTIFPTSAMSKIVYVSSSGDTLWGVNGEIRVPSGGTRGILYHTTNGGINWTYQLPDTSIHINFYFLGQFTDNLHGWAWTIAPTGIHTTTGGDTTFYLGILRIGSQTPKQFMLYQNYPNPFNPRTVIKYNIKKEAFTRMIVYDLTGRELEKLVDQKQEAGEYEVDFMGKFIASGIYFYSLYIDDKLVDTKKMILLK